MKRIVFPFFACVLGAMTPVQGMAAEKVRDLPLATPRAEDLRLLTEPSQSFGRSLAFAVGDGVASGRLEASAQDWSRATHLVLDLDYAADASGKFQLAFFGKGDAVPRLVVKVGLLPGTAPRVVLPLTLLDGQTLFLERSPGMLKTIVWGKSLPAGDISHVVAGLQSREFRQRLSVRGISLWSGAPPPVPPSDRPWVDTLGQWEARVWPGKTKNVEEMISRLKEEFGRARQARAARGPRAVVDGGRWSVGLRDGRWWFLDPSGQPFFSLGMAVATPRASTPLLPGTEGMHTELPPLERGSEQAVDYAVWNLKRTFGEGWLEAWSVLTDARLASWGFNTLGAWSDPALLASSDLPRTVILFGRSPAAGVRLLFRDLPDMFSPGFRDHVAKAASAAASFADDPRVVGYFIMNEPHWAFGRFNLAHEMLKREPGSETRRRLAEWLAARYHGDAESWSRAWGLGSQDFSSVVDQLFENAEGGSARAAEDLWAFSRLMVAEWTRVLASECRKAAPRLLNLGVRYAYIASDLLLEGSEHFDVFSINHYGETVPIADIERIHRATGKPVIVGEFHFGALDRGLPAAGLQVCASQEERAVAYRFYVEQAAAHPAVVGVHYFQLGDQSVLGRRDGENYQIGFVDVCHRPYPEIVEAARLSHERIPTIRAGALPPVTRRAQPKPHFPD